MSYTLEYIEFNPSRMMEEFKKNSGVPTLLDPDNKNTHAFNSSNLTKTVVDLTLPGIGGIELFQSFWVDRVPSILDNGFYVVTKVSHEIAPEKGWITKIQGRFRFNPAKNNRTS